MLDLDKKLEAFLQKHIPDALETDDLGVIADKLEDFIIFHSDSEGWPTKLGEEAEALYYEFFPDE